MNQTLDIIKWYKAMSYKCDQTKPKLTMDVLYLSWGLIWFGRKHTASYLASVVDNWNSKQRPVTKSHVKIIHMYAISAMLLVASVSIFSLTQGYLCGFIRGTKLSPVGQFAV